MKQLNQQHTHSLTPRPGMIDSHIHLDSQAYAHDLDDCLARARQQGVTAMLLPSTELESSRRIAQLMAQYPQLHGALGVHPHQAEQFDPSQTPAAWNVLLQQACWSAVGETGLECHYDFCPLETQKRSLEAHLELAHSTGLPLILHCRSAEEPLYDMLSQAGTTVQGVVHCFTGGWTWARKFLDLGLYLGVGGLATLPKASDVHEVVAQVPGDRWLLETDGPYLAPVPFRGYRNESCLLSLVVERVAQLRGADPAQVVEQSTLNGLRLFGLGARQDNSQAGTN
jgi:TatD DNase family protein